MSYFILVLAFLAILHFIYDGIVLPSIRMHLRNKLFALRDELRQIKICDEECDPQVFNLLHDGINRFLNRLHRLTIDRQVQFMREYENDDELRYEIDQRWKLVESCENEDVTRIFEEANDVLRVAYLANMGGWFFYLIPIALIAFSLKKLSNEAREMFVMPNREVDRLWPDSKTA
ncbi:hypothetical protein [Thiohalobacter sp. COW1]|uniref:hypothetical protein n=1 Tax=Thiohalobacter sp. COW1 TaxID=2795687 RepID=UPI0019167D79|nr:hypothetical protein [Thiohalobacter sp. COW1]